MWQRCGDAGKKVTKPYSINCNPFSRAMVSPLSTENPTSGKLVSNRLGRAAFTISPEPRASSCCADLPGDLALYAIYSPRPVARPSGQQSCSKSFILTILSVSRINSGAGLAHSFALRVTAPCGRSRRWLVVSATLRTLQTVSHNSALAFG
jgi:hypothetical protein